MPRLNVRSRWNRWDSCEGIWYIDICEVIFARIEKFARILPYIYYWYMFNTGNLCWSAPWVVCLRAPMGTKRFFKFWCGGFGGPAGGPPTMPPAGENFEILELADVSPCIWGPFSMDVRVLIKSLILIIFLIFQKLSHYGLSSDVELAHAGNLWDKCASNNFVSQSTDVIWPTLWLGPVPNSP